MAVKKLQLKNVHVRLKPKFNVKPKPDKEQPKKDKRRQ